mgnify:CR=1 FL=1
MEMISQKNKIFFLFHIFAIGLTDSLLFIGIGKLLIDKLNLLIGASLLFALNEFSKILFQFIFSTIDKKFSIKKSIIISELLQSIFLFFIVIFKFYSLTALIAILIILNFLESFFKINEFNLILTISQKEDRKKYNSYISTTNQISGVLGFVIGGFIIFNSQYNLLFIISSILFFISAIFISLIKIEDIKLFVDTSWKKLVKRDNYYILIFTFLIATNTVILSANSILGFKLALNTREIILYQIANAIGSSLATLIIKYKSSIINKNENNSIVFGLILQGILFYLFNFVSEDRRILLFISISMISFINLSIYNTKLQDYAETKFGSKILSKSLFNFFGISILTYFTIQLKIDYQNILAIFSFLTVVANILLIKNNITTYIIENNK